MCVVCLVPLAAGLTGQEGSVDRVVEERLLTNYLHLSTMIISPDLRQMVAVDLRGKLKTGTFGVLISPWYDGIAYDRDKYGPAGVLNYAFDGPTSRWVMDLLEGDVFVRLGRSMDSPWGRRYDQVFFPSLTYSPAGNHLAFAAFDRERKKWTLVVDGQEGAEYDGILNTHVSADNPDPHGVVWYQPQHGVWEFSEPGSTIAPSIKFGAHDLVQFSPDSKKIAYWARKGERWVLVSDGSEEGPYEAPGCIYFSPDSVHLAYTASTARKWFVVLDGKKGRIFDRIEGSEEAAGGFLYFRPDSKRLFYHAKEGGQRLRIIRDGDDERTGRADVTSPNGRRTAYVDGEKNDSFVVVDGVAGKRYSSVGSPQFSADSRKVAYGAQRGEDHFVVVDGIEGKHYPTVRSLLFSPDSNHLAYLAGTKGGVRKSASLRVVVDEQEGELQGLVHSVVFSPDSQRLAYVAVQDKGPRSWVVCDGQKHPAFAAVGDSPVFSPDSKHLVYPALESDHWTVVVDGKKGRPYPELLDPGLNRAIADIIKSKPFDSVKSKGVPLLFYVNEEATLCHLCRGELAPAGRSRTRWDPWWWYLSQSGESGFDSMLVARAGGSGLIRFDSASTFHYLVLKADGVFMVDETIRQPE